MKTEKKEKIVWNGKTRFVKIHLVAARMRVVADPTEEVENGVYQ